MSHPQVDRLVLLHKLEADAAARLRVLRATHAGGDAAAGAALLFCLRVLELWQATDYLHTLPAVLAAGGGSGGGPSVPDPDAPVEVVNLTASDPEEKMLADAEGQLVSMLIVSAGRPWPTVKPEPGETLAGGGGRDEDAHAAGASAKRRRV